MTKRSHETATSSRVIAAMHYWDRSVAKGCRGRRKGYGAHIAIYYFPPPNLGASDGPQNTALSPHISTRGSVPTHYHTRLHPHKLSDEAPSPHITTRGSVPAHYHTKLRPHTLPHEAPSPHITTRGSILTHV
ncbi:unnamed protein product [Ranitomeya imitator]|uniref:Uncharacterized protein n=1 Tax=Ranitomeya imitator TaxID=111125 RepID=A0ABN9MMN7_9NEOB|nr:unnamed protein product [Ranitomeya imitator]